jgi:hypothetical protein
MTPSAEPTSQGAQIAAHLVPADLLGGQEVIILAVKPSAWFVLLSSLPVLASATVVGVVAYVVNVYHPRTPAQVVLTLCAAGGMGRLIFACWQWLGRTYVLTNLRIIVVRGLMNVQVTAAGLTDVRRVVLEASLSERVVSAGSIFCLAGTDADPGRTDLADPSAVAWNVISRPQQIHEIIEDAVRRAHRAEGQTAAGGGQ